MSKSAGVKLEKIFDINMYLFIGKEQRGGISYIAKRYAKAKNKFAKNYDRKKPSKILTYLMNNLYGWAMSCRFKWLKNVDGFDQCSITERSSIGDIPEVDLEYPDDYPQKNLFKLKKKILMTCCKMTIKKLQSNMR